MKIEDNLIYGFQGGFRWLSNFWPVGVTLDGMEFRTTEHAYQAAKTLDDTERKTIQLMTRPGEAKAIGKVLTLRPDWEDVKLGVMLDLQRQKFLLGTDLGNKLQETGDAQIVEANTWGDRFWGNAAALGRTISARSS